MPRAPSPSDFKVEVEGIGNFVFAKKSMRDQCRIGAEYLQLTAGVADVDGFLDRLGTMLATFKILTVSQPDDWDLDALDPEDENDYIRLTKVWSAYREKVDTFRKKRVETSAA